MLEFLFTSCDYRFEIGVNRVIGGEVVEEGQKQVGGVVRI